MYQPFNAITGKFYTGEVNITALAMRAEQLKTRDPCWMTFLQAKDKGYKVKKGARSVKVRFAGRVEVQVEDGTYESRKVFKTYSVFNATEVEGITSYEANS